jgi:DNA-binding transcriptional regulator YiaG
MMPNVAKALKDEISRISRREVKSVTALIGKSHGELKKIVADLRKRVGLLERENRRLLARERKDASESPQTPSEETAKARLTSIGIRSLRSRLRLSQADFAKLLGTTAHSVYLWEKKDGALRPRDKTRAALLSIRGLGAREAKEKLGEDKGKSNRKGASSQKRTKTR